MSRFPKRYSHEDIARRCEQDAALKERVNEITKDARTLIVSEWEVSTAKKLQKQRLSQLQRSLSQQEEARLLDRRKALAALYTREREEWVREIESKVETPEARKARMLARATELKNQREAEKSQFVREKRRQQFCEASDILRSLQSQKTTRDVAERRGEQLIDKKKRVEDERTAELAYFQEMEAARQKAEEEEKQKYRERKDRYVMMKKGFEDQHRATLARRALEKARDAEQDRQQEELWKEQNRQIEEAERQAREEARLAGMAVKAFNVQRRGQRQARKEKERQEDLLLLEKAMQAEEEAARAEEKKLHDQEEATKRHLEALRSQMQRQREEESYTEGVRREYEERRWEEKEEEQRRQREARERLRTEVHATRDIQLEIQRNVARAEKEEELRYGALLQRQTEGLEKKEKELQALRIKQASMHQSLLQSQMREKQLRQQKEKQEEFLALRVMKQVEKEYKEQLQREMDAVGR